MDIYQVDGQWIASARGGRRNKDTVKGGELRLPARPEPIEKWQRGGGSSYGYGTHTYNRFQAGKERFILHSFSWSPASGYSWSESWEVLEGDVEPPLLGESYRWNGEGWESIPHPMAVVED